MQDDEALLLYAVVRGMRMSRVLEIGGLSGYSTKNFLQAMTPTNGTMYDCMHSCYVCTAAV